MDEPARPFAVSGSLGRYEIVAEIGRGAMGVVYHARDPHGRDVALKRIMAGRGDEEAAARFRREAREMAGLLHPNVVTVYEVGESEDGLFLAMEHVPGGSLRDFLAGRPPVEALVPLFVGVAEGLDHVHAKGLVHRDLKPENIVLSADGVPKITDFGLARRSQGGSRLTQRGALLGTFAYMAPEQVDTHDVPPAADLYSLGVCMYEAFAGRPPFEGRTDLALLAAHAQEVPRSPRSLRPDLPPALDALIMHLLAKRPEDRPASAGEVARRLRALTAPTPSAQVLIGRGALVEKLTRVLAWPGGPRVALVGGEGIGKSRVLQAVAAALAARGIRPLVVEPGHGLPPVLQTLGVPVSPALYVRGPSSVARELRDGLGRQPARVLLIDDWSRLDSGTREVLRHFVRLAPAEGTGWLAGMLPVDASLLPPEVAREPLEPLDADAMALLIRRQIAPDQAGLARWLEVRSGGSPRQLHLLAGYLRAVADRALTSQAGEIGPALLQAVEAMDPSVLQAAHLAALSPERLSLRALRGALEGGGADEALDALVRLGLLEEFRSAGGEAYRWTSALVARAVADSIPERQRRLLHGRLAGVTEGAEAARHLALAERWEEAVPALFAAADDALSTRSWAEAWALLDEVQVGLAAVPGLDRAGMLDLRLRLSAGTALVGLGRAAEARSFLEPVVARVDVPLALKAGALRLLARLDPGRAAEALACAGPLEDPWFETEVLRRAGEAQVRDGRWDKAVPLLDRAVALAAEHRLDEEGAQAALLLADSPLVDDARAGELLRGLPQEGPWASERELLLATLEGPDRVAARSGALGTGPRATRTLAEAEVRLGQPDAAEARLRRSLAAGDPSLRAALVDLLAGRGRLDEAAAWLQGAPADAWSQAARAQLNLLSGALTTAEERARAVLTHRSEEDRGARVRALCVLAEGEVLRRRHDDAARRLQAGARLAGRLPERWVVQTRSEQLEWERRLS